MTPAAADTPMTAVPLHRHFPELFRGQAEVNVTDLVQDSRAVTPGAGFVALRGTREHGLVHAVDAAARGACVILWDEDGEAEPAEIADTGVPALRVPGLRSRLPALARAVFGAWPEDAPVVAVTGTDGKTSVTHLVAAALEQLGTPAGVIGTLGAGRPAALHPAGHTTPGVLELHRHLADLARNGCRAVALEASSHGLVQGRLDGIPVSVAVLTRLGTDHLDFHGSQAAYAEAKATLFDRPGLHTRVINADDELGRELLRRPVPAGVADLTWGADLSTAMVRAEAVEATPQGLAFTLVADGQHWSVRSRLYGRFQVENLLATLATLHALGHSWEAAAEAVAGLPGVPGRMERFELPSGALLVVDYAHTAQALEAALTALRPHSRGRLSVVFGCGGDRDPGKRAAMGRVAARHADRVIVTDDNPRHEDPAAIRAAVLAGCGAAGECCEIADREAAVRDAVANAGAGDIVLLAGKGHETTQQVGDTQRPFSDRTLAARLAHEPIGEEG
ncbi:UDP-N-acetylmuramoyl-L-alanyl-D-glutamate--2,6-diaminopimelate ligase [Thioalkalivibrio sp. ALJ24]|uniref:UDP-N-acetylmuramoyl-L-alanyl-D-glutamate--2, 6-diaminopimelate ligase n=1 Tax=Thioalkalivibrio sp. ALJ24 TaxID=545276 RepID=UPI0003764835